MTEIPSDDTEARVNLAERFNELADENRNAPTGDPMERYGRACAEAAFRKAASMARASSPPEREGTARVDALADQLGDEAVRHNGYWARVPFDTLDALLRAMGLETTYTREPASPTSREQVPEREGAKIDVPLEMIEGANTMTRRTAPSEATDDLRCSRCDQTLAEDIGDREALADPEALCGPACCPASTEREGTRVDRRLNMERLDEIDARPASGEAENDVAAGHRAEASDLREAASKLRSSPPEREGTRVDCGFCGGGGFLRDRAPIGSRCPRCGGTGAVEPASTEREGTARVDAKDVRLLRELGQEIGTMGVLPGDRVKWHRYWTALSRIVAALEPAPTQED